MKSMLQYHISPVKSKIYNQMAQAGSNFNLKKSHIYILTPSSATYV